VTLFHTDENDRDLILTLRWLIHRRPRNEGMTAPVLFSSFGPRHLLCLLPNLIGCKLNSIAFGLIRPGLSFHSRPYDDLIQSAAV